MVLLRTGYIGFHEFRVAQQQELLRWMGQCTVLCMSWHCTAVLVSSPARSPALALSGMEEGAMPLMPGPEAVPGSHTAAIAMTCAPGGEVGFNPKHPWGLGTQTLLWVTRSHLSACSLCSLGWFSSPPPFFVRWDAQPVLMQDEATGAVWSPRRGSRKE